MKFISLFSGIEAASVAFNPLGWEAVAFSEIEPFPSAVLRHRYPDTPNLGDITTVRDEQVKELGPVDLAVFGWPCQDLSVAGQRKGLMTDDGEKTRSGLFFDALRLVRASGARWFIGENVPGLLSSKGGEDFALVLSAITGLNVPVPKQGWQNSGVVAVDDPRQFSVAWGCLDAQHFGIPQRRRRIFLVGYFGDWRPPAAVLFNRESLRRDSKKGKGAGEEVAAPITSSFAKHHGRTAGNNGGVNNMIPFGVDGGGTGFALRANPSHSGDKGDGGVNTTLVGFAEIGHSEYREGMPVRRAYNGGECGGGSEALIAPALTAPSGKGAFCDPVNDGIICFAENQRGEIRESDVALSINTAGGKPGSGYPAVRQASQVRRLTPREAERLQGLPDDWTLVPWRGKLAPDGPRYKAVGNSMATPVVRWIGKRIMLVEELLCERRAAA